MRFGGQQAPQARLADVVHQIDSHWGLRTAARHHQLQEAGRGACSIGATRARIGSTAPP